jgi:hypothetical protein
MWIFPLLLPRRIIFRTKILLIAYGNSKTLHQKDVLKTEQKYLNFFFSNIAKAIAF